MEGNIFPIDYMKLSDDMWYVKSDNSIDIIDIIGSLVANMSFSKGEKLLGIWNLSGEQSGIPKDEPMRTRSSVPALWYLTKGNLSSSCSKLTLLIISTGKEDKFPLSAIFRGFIDSQSILFIGAIVPDENFIHRLLECRRGYNAIPKNRRFFQMDIHHI